MKYGRIIENVIQEIFIEEEGKTLENYYHPDLCSQFEVVPDDVDNGYSLINEVWTAPPEPPVYDDAEEEI